MFEVEARAAGALAFFDRPTTSTLVVAIVLGLIGWVLHVAIDWTTRPETVEPGPATRPPPLTDGRVEPPAVVALLTNGFDVPRTAVTATALDLAARGWIRLTSIDGELVVVTRGSASAGDSLRPFEQQVRNHLAARAFNDVTSANTLAASHHRLDRSWWLRFSRSVVDDAQAAGLTSRRFTPAMIAPPAVATALGLVAAWRAAREGEEIALDESWTSRLVWLATIAGLLLLAWHTVQRAIGSAQRPTELGAERSALWLGFRSRLRERIPEHATVIAPPPQQLALAHASVMGVAEHVLDELPAAPEDHHAAWSEAGGRAHLVKVRYPIRPGYGQHPIKVGVAGAVVLLVARWVRNYLRQIADGEALESLLERVPGQIELIEQIASILAVLCWLPILWGAWAVLAGAIDAVATRERIGAVVRARRPVEVLPPRLLTVVRPFAERDRFSTYLAVDDGKRTWITAWLANERTAAPQGAQARVRATPMLGYVRSSEPVGTATRGTD